MKHQGDLAELKFMLLSHELGYTVSKPFGDNAKYDLIVDNGLSLERIQIKSTKRMELYGRNDCYNCLSCFGRDSKQRYTKDHIDFMVIYIIPEDAWYKIPIDKIKSKCIKLYPHRKPNRGQFEIYRIK